MVKQLLIALAVMLAAGAICPASPTYLQTNLGDASAWSDDDSPAGDVPTVVELADRRQAMDPPVTVAIPLPGALSEAMITLPLIGLLFVARRRRRLI